MRSVYTTREEWLADARDQIGVVFEEHGGTVPSIRVGVAWPSGGVRSRVRGETWARSASGDNAAEITIRMTETDPVEILGILIHEMAHAVGFEFGHGKEYGKLLEPFGLEGRLTATKPGEELRSTLAIMVQGLGAYPMGSFLGGIFGGRVPGPGDAGGDDGAIKSSGSKTQTTRYIKVECPQCGYTARITRKWLAQGNPSCPEGDEMGEAS
jgi:hypothetical protein